MIKLFLMAISLLISLDLIAEETAIESLPPKITTSDTPAFILEFNKNFKNLRSGTEIVPDGDDNEKEDKIIMDTNKNFIDLENHYIDVSVLKEIKRTILGVYIQNNKITSIKDLELKIPYIMLQSSSRHLDKGNRLYFRNGKLKEDCLLLSNNKGTLKMCNFKDTVEIVKNTNEFFKYYFLKTLN